MEFFAYDKKYYLGLGGYYYDGDTIEDKHDDIDSVGHEIRKAIDLLKKGNPNLLVTLFNDPSSYLELSTGGKLLLNNKELFVGANNIKNRFIGYANSQIYRMQKGSYKGFMGAKRKRIVDKYGYDTKNAMTLIRLLQEGIELLTTGNLTIRKEGEERQLLIDIKCAKYKLEEIKEMSNKLFTGLETAYEKTSLPKTLNDGKIDDLLNKILELELNL